MTPVKNGGDNDNDGGCNRKPTCGESAFHSCICSHPETIRPNDTSVESESGGKMEEI
ncbi:hypothetical protein D3C75_1036760 [compost metagenome]